MSMVPSDVTLAGDSNNSEPLIINLNSFRFWFNKGPGCSRSKIICRRNSKE